MSNLKRKDYDSGRLSLQFGQAKKPSSSSGSPSSPSSKNGSPGVSQALRQLLKGHASKAINDS